MVGSMGASARGHGTSSLHNRELPPIKTEKVDVDASYRAATIEIRTRNPQMDADWDRVREEIGYLKLYSQIREINAIAQRKAVEAVSTHVHDGLRLRNIHSDKGNVFGSIAFNQYMASRKKETELTALPKYGVKIDVRIFPPEIDVETHVKGVSRSS